jgi:hypothetical protein
LRCHKTDVGKISGGDERTSTAGHVENAQATIVLAQDIEYGIVNPGLMAKFEYVLLLRGQK